ncbi:MAG: hypothetical protein ACR2MZ_00975 [Candidatus Dormibacter sp.]|uniref:hypothetical protein n=1 Tax=Candidatus Dormibacter sp. TaxID=2973982 RepID=UPI000DB8CEC5|nr:MAG: hypothetical protein DLM66_09440 [Candidatus Dormibacteraeota bacterium]
MFSNLAARAEEISGATREAISAWRGKAAVRFTDHMLHRLRAGELLADSVDGAAAALRTYATVLRRAQQLFREAEQEAHSVGLALLGPVIDPRSLLPPTAEKAMHEPHVAWALAEAERQRYAAACDLVLALHSLHPKLSEAGYLLGDHSGLSPLGFAGDFVKGAGGGMVDLGLGLASMVAKTAPPVFLTSPQARTDLTDSATAEASQLWQHPESALDLAGLPDPSLLTSGHPGEFTGRIAAWAATTLTPGGADGADEAAAAARANSRVEAIWQRLDSPTPKYKEHIRLVHSQEGLNAAHGDLVQDDATDIPGRPTYPGHWQRLPGGIEVGYRPASKSGGPGVDIRYPDGRRQRTIHISPWPSK